MEIILYYAPVTCALAPYITLTEAEAHFEVRPLNLRKDQHKSSDYLKLNPKHKVPLLIVDGKVLSESVGHSNMDCPYISAGEASAGRSVAGTQGDLDAVLVRLGPSTRSWPGSTHRRGSATCRAPKRACVGWPPTSCHRELQDRRRSSGRTGVLLRPFHGAGRAFLLDLPPWRRQFDLDLSGLSQLHGAFRAHEEPPERPASF